MTVTSAVTNTGLASGVEAFVRARVGDTIGPLGLGELVPVDSITNFVYRVPATDGELIAKYSVLGLSKPTLVRRFAEENGDPE